MPWVRVLAFAAVVALCATAADVKLELHLKRVVSEEKLQQEFLDRAMPGSSKYLQHLSVEGVTELVRPREGAVAAAKKFLAGTDGASWRGTFITGDVVKAVVSTGTAAAAELGVTEEGDEATVPSPLLSFVERVVVVRDRRFHTAQGPAPLRSGESDSSSTTFKSFFNSTSNIPNDFTGTGQNPHTILKRYNIPNTTVSWTTAQGVAEFSPMGFSQKALDAFNRHYGLAQTQVLVSGPNPSEDSSSTPWGTSEGQLDVEYLAAVAPNATTWWIEAGGKASWAEWVDQVLSLHPLPAVVSISWGEGEWWSQLTESTSSLSTWPSSTASIPAIPASLLASEDAFRKLSLAGVTAVAAAGDNGPGRWGPPDGQFGGTPCTTRFGPVYPATSQYVTAVGATYANSTNGDEAAVSWSGGGFSEFIQRPQWQEEVVSAYLAANHTGMAPRSTFNASGRAYPDVSALGTNFDVEGLYTYYTSKTTTANYHSTYHTSPEWNKVAGTSASTPTFAGIITRIVAERKAKGKGTLGCITPTLYGLKKVGQDVTKGKTGDGCWTSNSEFTGVGDGFPAAVGWDAASGFGTPDYEYLLSQFA